MPQIWLESYCFLEHGIDHSGTKIIFDAISPSAVTDSTYTNVEGFYQIEVAAGIYDVHFAHEGYYDEEVSALNCFSIPTIPDLILLKIIEGIHLSGYICGGDSTVVDTGYTETCINTLIDTMYIIDDWLYIGACDTLTIEPGATLYFNEGTGLTINGPLQAIGTETDSIKFLPNRKTNGWEGINVQNNEAFFRYCYITGAQGGGIISYDTSPTISNCVIDKNLGPALYLYNSEALISNCIITRNYGYAVDCNAGSPTLMNCIISYNWGGSIRSEESNARIINTIISNNGGEGIHVVGESNVRITYSNFYGNYGGVIYGEIPYLGQLIMVNSNGDSCDAYYNIFADPLFVNTATIDTYLVEVDPNVFRLMPDSPNIDAGDPSMPPDPDLTVSDIGAFYFHQGPHPEIATTLATLDFGNVVVNSEATLPLGFKNTGTLDLIIHNISTSSADYTAAWDISDSTITPGGVLSVPITFQPTTYTQYRESLSIGSNDKDITINLFGAGIPPEGIYPTSLILTGGGSDSLNWDYFINNTSPSTNDAYSKLAYGRYYGDQRLLYMNPITWQDLDGDNVDDAIVDQDIITPQTFHNALLSLYDEAVPQFPNVIILAGHGHVGEFDINGNLADNILIDTLAIWLNEAELDIATPLVVLVEACFSGSYLPTLSEPNRIIITACREDQFADYLNGESFSTHFWHEVWYGNNLWDSFSFASDWSIANLNGQEPLLDANGNGMPNELEDQQIASNMFLGGQYMHGAGLPKIVNFPAELELENSRVTVWAECSGIMDHVWFRIFPQNYTGIPTISELPYVEMTPISGSIYQETYYDDGFVNLGRSYYVQIEAVDDIYNFAVPRAIPLTVISLDTYRAEALPIEYRLHPNYPNPFNPVSTIRYELPQASDVSLIVYDILGREVARLLDSYMEPGYHQTVWNGRNASGRELPSGIYIARLITLDYSKSIKMALLK